MSSNTELADLRRRFIDDRESLQEREYAQLLEAAKASPQLAAELHEQLMIDDLLSQRFTLDRRRFDAQVEQRISDFLRGEEELNCQADELRALALARIEQGPTEPRIGRSTLVAWGVAAVLLLAVGVTTWIWQQQRYDNLTATVRSVEGEVLIRRAPQAADQYAEAETKLQLGDEVEVGEEGKISLMWSDGTSLELSSDSAIELPETLQGKRVHLRHGSLSASISKQRDNEPMIFSTPHAEAIVRGTALQLHIEGDDTRLHVEEGEVEFVERQTRTRTLVAASESAVATAGQQVAKSSNQWPATREGLVYLFSPARPSPLMKTAGGFKPTQWTGLSSDARLNERGEIELSGGYLNDKVSQLGAALRGATEEFTIELLLNSGQAMDQHPKTIFSLQSEQGSAFSIAQGEEQESEVDHVVTIAPSTAEELTQVVVICRPKQGLCQVFVDGEAQRDQQLRLPAWCWDVTALTVALGSSEQEAHWHGRIAGIGIYDRAVTQVKR